MNPTRRNQYRGGGRGGGVLEADDAREDIVRNEEEGRQEVGGEGFRQVPRRAVVVQQRPHLVEASGFRV